MLSAAAVMVILVVVVVVWRPTVLSRKAPGVFIEGPGLNEPADC